MAFDLTEPGLLLSPEVLADPRPLYDQLRREAPVWQVPGQDTFLVSDPGLVREAVGRHIPRGTEELNNKALAEGGLLVADMDVSRFHRVA